MFQTSLILSNIWAVAALIVNEPAPKLYCASLGIIWAVLALVVHFVK